MKEQAPPLSPDALNSLFAQLNPLDVEQFYTAYQLWSTRQRIQTLQALMDAIQRDIVENMDAMAEVHPSALALATLARLQANGVSDIALLDHMLERGEEWLDRTMQHLEYCEKLDVISGNYTKWCENALEGAYDWIDSMLGQETETTASDELPPMGMTMLAEIGPVEQKEDSEEGSENDQPTGEVMEELFLQKLMSDETETLPSMLETTLKVCAIPQPPQSELVILPTEQETRPEEVESTPVLADTEVEHTEVTMIAVEEQEEQPDVAQNGETVHEDVALAADTPEAQELVIIHEPQIEDEVEQDAALANSEPAHQQDGVPAMENAGIATSTTVASPIVPKPEIETKRKRGFWRTLIEVLFHI